MQRFYNMVRLRG